VQNNGQLITLTSSTLSSISGAFNLNNVTALITLDFAALSSVGSISWLSVPLLATLKFTTGITKAASVIISDTYLSTLSGINIQSASTMDINNNNRLTEFSSSLANLSTLLNIQANGAGLQVSLPNLIWIANMSIANVTSFSAPSLTVVNGSMRFDSNYFTGFSAPNMTSTQSGDISFIDNANLKNVTFPKLTSTGGSIVIANNTALTAVNGFAVLKKIGGAVKLRGNFTR
jgi:hypothetical protein